LGACWVVVALRCRLRCYVVTLVTVAIFTLPWDSLWITHICIALVPLPLLDYTFAPHTGYPFLCWVGLPHMPHTQDYIHTLDYTPLLPFTFTFDFTWLHTPPARFGFSSPAPFGSLGWLVFPLRCPVGCLAGYLALDYVAVAVALLV